MAHIVDDHLVLSRVGLREPVQEGPVRVAARGPFRERSSVDAGEMEGGTDRLLLKGERAVLLWTEPGYSLILSPLL